MDSKDPTSPAPAMAMCCFLSKAILKNLVKGKNFFKRIVQRHGRNANHIRLAPIGNNTSLCNFIKNFLSILFHEQRKLATAFVLISRSDNGEMILMVFYQLQEKLQITCE